MKTEDVKNLSSEERLLYFINERESIRRKKVLGLPAPWTDDEILQTYRFCNIRRMDDKVSDWLLRNWYRPYKDHPNMLVAAALARHFNLSECLAKIGFPKEWNPDEIKRTARGIKASGGKIFNGAYMVRGIGTADKTEMVVDRVCQPLIDNQPLIDTSNMQKSVEVLLPYWGFSSFMAGQVVADLRWGLSGSWQDKKTWAPQGPGSLRGINRLNERHPNDPAAKHNWETEFPAVMKLCLDSLPQDLTKRLEAIDYQNCLCEYDKYSRTLFREGRPKQRYQGI